ncbi:MAG: hypothetical protein JJ895_12460 [Balneolaceae bacterium]|nr:hypothetical protein [Balneolaceae bacterium]
MKTEEINPSIHEKLITIKSEYWSLIEDINNEKENLINTRFTLKSEYIQIEVLKRKYQTNITTLRYLKSSVEKLNKEIDEIMSLYEDNDRLLLEWLISYDMENAWEQYG